jgi:ketosteroid isomerase-like protein
MSQENVEIVRRAFAEFARGNFWVTEIFDPAIRVRWLDGAATIGLKPETVGAEALANSMKSWLNVYEAVTLTAERIVEAADRVVVLAAWRGHGKVSGVPTEWRHSQIWTLSGGRVTDIVSYNDPAEALEAVGLSE